jgi:hypothetical protein
MKFLERLYNYPPCLVRLLARYPKEGPISAVGIAVSGDLNPVEVEAISQCVEWSDIKVGQMARFIRGCGFNFEDRLSNKRMDNYIRSNPNFEYLRRDEAWDSYYKPLMILWVSSRVPILINWQPMRNLLVRLQPITNFQPH